MYACCVLHNIARENNIPMDDVTGDDDDNGGDNRHLLVGDASQDGKTARENLVRDKFT